MDFVTVHDANGNGFRFDRMDAWRGDENGTEVLLSSGRWVEINVPVGEFEERIELVLTALAESQ